MAEASYDPPIPDRDIILRLNRREAEAIASIGGYIGGQPLKSYRGDWDNIFYALTKLDPDLTWGNFTEVFTDQGRIAYKNHPDKK